jgi:hypothetical protein
MFNFFPIVFVLTACAFYDTRGKLNIFKQINKEVRSNLAVFSKLLLIAEDAFLSKLMLAKR